MSRRSTLSRCGFSVAALEPAMTLDPSACDILAYEECTKATPSRDESATEPAARLLINAKLGPGSRFHTFLFLGGRESPWRTVGPPLISPKPFAGTRVPPAGGCCGPLPCLRSARSRGGSGNAVARWRCCSPGLLGRLRRARRGSDQKVRRRRARKRRAHRRQVARHDRGGPLDRTPRGRAGPGGASP